MTWDFKKQPELPNSQMEFYYLQSPHKQITEDFDAEVVKVIDGDTIRLKTTFRDFDFPLRFLGTNAKELSEGGQEAKEYLKGVIEGELVRIIMDRKNRVGKYGRLLGIVMSLGMNMNETMIRLGLSTTFEGRDEGKLPNLNQELNIEQWF